MMERFATFLGIWDSLVETLGYYATHPDAWWDWARLLLVNGVPTVVLALPVYFIARLRGRRPAFLAVATPVIVTYAGISLLMLVQPPMSADLRFALGIVFAFALVAVTWLWIPVAGLMAYLGLRRRRRDLERASQKPDPSVA